MGRNFLEYDEEADTLVIRKAGEKVSESINDRYICLLELNKKKEIIGLEFLSVRKTFNIPLDVLKRLKDSKVNMIYDHKAKLLTINVLLLLKKEHVIHIPMNADMGKKDFIINDFKEAKQEKAVA